MSIAADAIDQAEPHHREWIAWLYDCWDDLNVHHFGGQLATPFIHIAQPIRHAMADAAPADFDDPDGPACIRIHPLVIGERTRPPRQGQPPGLLHRMVLDDLAHEAVHVWQAEVLGWAWRASYGDRWHGQEFKDKLAALKLELGPLDSCGLSRR
jgi:hypothetical protein